MQCAYQPDTFCPTGTVRSTQSSAATLPWTTPTPTTRWIWSFKGVARVFKAIANRFDWKHIVVVSDYETESPCWYGARPFSDVFGSDENYTFAWLRFGSNPKDEEFDDILHEIRARTRGFYSLASRFMYHCY